MYERQGQIPCSDEILALFLLNYLIELRERYQKQAAITFAISC